MPCGQSHYGTTGWLEPWQVSPWIREITFGSFIVQQRFNRTRYARYGVRPRRCWNSMLKETSSRPGAGQDKDMNGRNSNTGSTWIRRTMYGSAAPEPGTDRLSSSHVMESSSCRLA